MEHDEYEARIARREASRRLGMEGWEKAVLDIQLHPETKLLSRDQFLQTFRYVEELYPKVAPCVAATRVYKNTNTAFCRKLGIPRQAGGCFIVKASVVLVCYCKIPDDVVLVHELLHFSSQLMGSDFSSEAAEEDFAYRKSIPYLRQKGHDDEWISKTFLLGYYLGMEMNARMANLGPLAARFSRTEKEEARKAALATCQQLIDEEMEALGPPPRIVQDRFDFL